MTCAPCPRLLAQASAPRPVRPALLRRDDAPAQFARFVLVGVVSNAAYAALFVLLAGFGDQPANLVGAVASYALANELHRRITFRAGDRVTWWAAQWRGGGIAAAGLAASSLALGWWNSVEDTAGTVDHLVVVGIVTGVVGLLRFALLRWAFGGRAARPARSRSGAVR